MPFPSPDNPRDPVQHTRQLARSLKHRAELLRRHRLEPLGTTCRDAFWGTAEHVFPYEYDEGFYPHHFIRRPSLGAPPTGHVPRQIFCAWFGPAMPENRRRSYRAVQTMNPRFETILVTPENISDFIVEGHDIHPCFQYLSPVHKSDYIRCYLMHFHGGVWTDLKPPRASWEPVARHIDTEPDLWAAGYPEVSTSYIEEEVGALGKHLKRHYRATIGPSAYMFKPNSPFTDDWWRELNHRLDYWKDALMRFPATDPYHIPREHPISWAETCGAIIHPLSLKYHSHILRDDRMRPVLKDYR